MPYSSLRPITLADALNDTNPLWPDGCGCGVCKPGATQEARTATIARETTRDTWARKQRPQTAINELIEMAVKRYGG